MHIIHHTPLSVASRFVLILAIVAAAVVALGEVSRSRSETLGHSSLRLETPSRANSFTSDEVTPVVENLGAVMANGVIHSESADRFPAAGPEMAKHIPSNAVTPSYRQSMVDSDSQLGTIFGGSGAVAAANGFEPEALASHYPRYRGDVIGDDGQLHRGHLSFAMHLYGSVDGTGDTDLYVPSGFTSHSSMPTPTDAAVTFYYPRLGNLANVTLAVFHIANFGLSYEEGGRVRIGSIGGPGGSVAYYKHSHIEFYRGDTGLPSGASRPGLRIDPAAVFETPKDVASQRPDETSDRSSH